MWKEDVSRRSNVVPPFVDGLPFMPSRASGASSTHGMLRRFTVSSPASCGLSVRLPPGLCPWCVFPFTLRLTVRVRSVVLLRAIVRRP